MVLFVDRITAHRVARRILQFCVSNFHNVVLRSKRYGIRVKKTSIMLSNV